MFNCFFYYLSQLQHVDKQIPLNENSHIFMLLIKYSDHINNGKTAKLDLINQVIFTKTS